MENPQHGSGAPGRDETEKERIDRNVSELLGELRVALPGVQVLFAFLLVLPFNQRFVSVTGFQKAIYLVTLLATALSAVILIAPSMQHRLQFREDNKAAILHDANRLAVLGASVLAVAMCGVVMLVTDYVFGTVAMLISVAGLVIAIGLLWYAVPALRLRQRRARG